MTRPLNGEKTHPLTDHAKGVLKRLDRDGALPRSEINPGVSNRFAREGLTKVIRKTSPYITHKGKLVDFEEITDAGRAAIASAHNDKCRSGDPDNCCGHPAVCNWDETEDADSSDKRGSKK